MISRKLVLALGTSQLVLWGITFYLIGVFGDLMIADLGWSRTLVHSGFSVALLVMAATSPFVGKLIDEIGGKLVMSIGALLSATGCAVLSVADTVPVYFCAWLILGLAMRCCLYDAAFATLARIAGADAKPPIAKITLLGGLAATCFWPIGHFLAEQFGWRGAVQIYALIGLLMVPLHWIIPNDKHVVKVGPQAAIERTGQAAKSATLVPALLYASIIALGNGLHAGMSSHLISILAELGLGAAAAVFIAALRGVGQTTARLIDVLFGGRLHPTTLNLIAALILPASFFVGLIGGGNPSAAIAFVFTYGCATGLLTITRGTLPLVLFDTSAYGALVGKLLVPSFVLSAAAPMIFAVIIERYGAIGSLYASLFAASLILVASLYLRKAAPR